VSAKAGSAQLSLFEPARAERGFAVRVTRRSRRLTVRVYPGGRVEVAVPHGTRPAMVERFVEQHRAWIDARLVELASQPRALEPPLPETVELRALGSRVRVHYLVRRRAGWRRADSGALLIFGDRGDLERTRDSLRAWLTEAAREALEPWLRRLAAEHGFPLGQVQLRRQQTRWGSCSRSGTVSLNVCLMFQPPDVVRYLMLHELCHTRHMNHSARFWRLVESLEPDYRALDRQLTRGWQHVPGWVYG
jgi:predicted metal-dependent hydrolase